MGLGQSPVYRLGGWRPNVFFGTGLELGMWMTAVALTAWWLWRCGTIKRIGQYPFGPVLLPILMITTIICRSAGALALLFAGMGLLWASVRFRTRALLVVLLLAGPLYVSVRTTNLWCGQQAVELSGDGDRGGPRGITRISLQVRELARGQGARTTDLRMGGVGAQLGLFQSKSDVAYNGPDGRLVDHYPWDQRVRRAGPVLRGHDLASGAVRLAMPTGAMG